MLQFIDSGSVTSVQGFKAAGINCGIKKYKKDLAIIYSDVPCNAAGTFTLNKVIAAPLILSKKIINKKKKVRAILINSGNANACTGEEGLNNAIKMQQYCATKIGIQPDEILISSTGVIGQQLPMKNLLSGIDVISNEIDFCKGNEAAEAIMTTDKKKKAFAVKIRLLGSEVVIGGICKGSGMIMPNMATMLAFLTTDALIEHDLLQQLLNEAVNESFNKISVDGETSTNDMVVLLSNGKSGINITNSKKDYETFRTALITICSEMAKSITSDGEGATKLITVSVNNAKSKKDADAIARAMVNSPLFKTAMNGNDANWGRILSAAGNSGADFNPEKVAIKFDELSILKPNYQFAFSEEDAKKVLSKDKVTVSIDLNEGIESSTWWTCDFSEEYVKINANYRT